MSNQEGNNVYSNSLFKFNSNLLGDTIYSTKLTYDSLCPYQITNDTVILDNCGLIVGDDEIWFDENQIKDIPLIYPNPASEYIMIKSSKPDIYIQLINFSGQAILTSEPGERTVSLRGIHPGLYIATIEQDNTVIARENLIVR